MFPGSLDAGDPTQSLIGRWSGRARHAWSDAERSAIVSYLRRAAATDPYWRDEIEAALEDLS